MDPKSYTTRHPLQGDELPPKDSTLYKSVCMRFLYLVQDRPECQFASKELTRAMSKPTVSAMEALKHSAVSAWRASCRVEVSKATYVYVR